MVETTPKLRIVHALLETAHGPLGYSDLTAGGRGVTGSEQTMLYLARAQAQRGHSVVMYLPTDKPGYEHGVEILDVRASWPRLRRIDGADVVISWLSADPLRFAGPKALKIHSLQINDWMLCGADYHKHVDVFVACSQAHKEHLLREGGHPPLDYPFEVIPNGTDIARFSTSLQRKPRRCVYLSSPDRGLHWLIAMWPEIRFAYPDAELHIYYEVQKWLDGAILLTSEIGNRARYVINHIQGIAKHAGVMHGAVPPENLAHGLASCDVMLYPADTIRFTEGFGVAVLEACAAGVVPIITDADALGEVYQKSGAIIIPRGPDRRWTDRFLDTVLTVFKDRDALEALRPFVRNFAAQYDWSHVADLWDAMFMKYRR